MPIGGIDECFGVVLLWHCGFALANRRTFFYVDRVVFFYCESGFSVHEGVWLSWDFASSGLMRLGLFAVEGCFEHKQVFDCLSHWVVNSLMDGLSCCSGLRLTPWLEFVCAVAVNACFQSFVQLSLIYLNLFFQICVEVLSLCPQILLSTSYSTTVLAVNDRLSLGYKKLDIFVLFVLLLTQL